MLVLHLIERECSNLSFLTLSSVPFCLQASPLLCYICFTVRNWCFFLVFCELLEGTGEVWEQLFFCPQLTCRPMCGRTSLRKALPWTTDLQIKGVSHLGHDLLAHSWACCGSRYCWASSETLVSPLMTC